MELNVRTHMRLASVTSDGDFAYVQIGCTHVTCKREGDRIVLVAGSDCQLAASGRPNTNTEATAVGGERLSRDDAMDDPKPPLPPSPRPPIPPAGPRPPLPPAAMFC
jgi:hypothetical protein